MKPLAPVTNILFGFAMLASPYARLTPWVPWL